MREQTGRNRKGFMAQLGGGRAGFSPWRGWLWLWLACGIVLPALTQERPDIVWIRDGHTQHVYSVSFSPDGRLLASGSEDNTIKLWRVADGALRQTYNEIFGAFSIQFSSDGRLFGYGRADATVVVARNPFWQSGKGNPQPKNVKPAM
jgi:WD40 repeat protein